LLDQRGTGRSTPVTAQTLQHLQAEEACAYLVHFRADSIVKDCEVIRSALGVSRISLLGQSFGGFCSLSYLSFFPDSLDKVFITGGLAPLLASSPAEVYRSLYHRVLERNKRYYSRYPGDITKIREIITHLEGLPGGFAPLPRGGRLTARRFKTLGLQLGSGEGLEAMHWLVEEAFLVKADGSKELDERFLMQVEQAQSFDDNPLYWLLHETIYCGPETGASSWAAFRVLREAPFARLFDHTQALEDSADSDAVMLTGEMVFPWFSEDFAALGSLSKTAELLAQKSDWCPLYDVERLRNTSVKVIAAMYYDDMYVERVFSEDVVRLLGANCKVWVTNEFQHSGLRDGGGRVFDTLLKMSAGELGIPS